MYARCRRRSARPDTLVGPLIDGAPSRECNALCEAGARAAGSRRASASRGRRADGVYVRPAIVEMPAQSRCRSARDLRADSLRDALPRLWRRRSRCTTMYRRVCRRLSSRPICGKRNFFCRRGLRLRDRQREHRTIRRRNRRSVRRRKRNRRRTRIRVRFLESLHAARDEYDQLRVELPLAQGVKFDIRHLITTVLYLISTCTHRLVLSADV